MTRKRNLIIILVVLAVVIVGKVGYDAIRANFLYGGGWQPTLEEALEQQAKTALPGEAKKLTAVTVLDRQILGESAYLLYVSADDTLVLGAFRPNKDGNRWRLENRTEETDPNALRQFLMNGDPEQVLLCDYRVDRGSGRVLGWKWTGTPDVLVNGERAETRTVTFRWKGQTRSVDCWWRDGVDLSGTTAVGYVS